MWLYPSFIRYRTTSRRLWIWRGLWWLVYPQFEWFSPPPDLHPIPASTPWVHRWPHVEKSKLMIFWVDWSSIIIVYYVAHITSTSIHNPVMSIKRKLITVFSKQYKVIGRTIYMSDTTYTNLIQKAAYYLSDNWMGGCKVEPKSSKISWTSNLWMNGPASNPLHY